MVHSPPSPQALLGGRFEVEHEVGRGGVGVVYRALDRTTGQLVALKLIAATGIDALEEARFLREGRMLEELEHPHIVKLVACGAEDGFPYVAMEWLEGEDLAARQRRAPLGIGPALEVARQVALALDTAHAAGIVHRDVKPSNVFLLSKQGDDDKPHAKLVDFGVALRDDARLTRTGVVVGTPAYMAPEQAKAEGTPDRRADIYSLGATLFELLTGRPPHVGPTAIATLAKLVTTDAPKLSELITGVPPALDRLVTRMLETDPKRRPDDAREVAIAIAEIAADASARGLALPQGAAQPPAADATHGTRLVTSIVALSVGERRLELVRDLRARGADAVALGDDALVAHLGARRSVGGEAARALELARWLAESGGKVGVATGRSKVDLTRPVGDVVDRAAALAHAASRSQVLADSTTAELSQAQFQFQPRSERSSVVGPPLSAPRENAVEGIPFVGREAELAQVLAAFERCVEDQTPIVVTVSGPPGIGKSRLGYEVVARLLAQTAAPRVVTVQSAPFAREHVLGTAADIVRKLVASPSPDGGSLKSEPLARLLAGEPLPEGQGTRGARDELWLAMTDVVVEVASRGPCVVVLEDLQWGDPESLAWIEHALVRATGRPLLLLCLVRPQFFHDKETRFEGRDHLRLELRPVSKRSSRLIARALLGESMAADVLERIAEQAAGSPLFARELARLAALGQDAKKAPTIEAAIQVSLDALDAPARDAVARLSVFGLSGWDHGLEALGVLAAEPSLHRLAASELLFERAESRFAGTREWAFKHALVRDVAYALLGDAERQGLHARAGAWLAQQGEDAATVAKHLELGGHGAEAAVHWERAARRALAINALSDAVRMADMALAQADDQRTAFARALLLDEAYSRLDPRAADRETAVSALANAAYDEASALRAAGARARFDDARGVGIDLKARLEAVRAGAARLGLLDEEMRSTAILAMRAAFEGELEAAEHEAEHLFAMSKEPKLAAAAVDAWQCLAVVRQTKGALVAALEARRAAASAASQAGLKERESMLNVNLGFALTTIGARAEARQAILAGLGIAEAIGSVGAIRHGRMNLLGWTATFGPDPELDGELAEVRAEADQAGGSAWVAPDRATLGLLFYRGLEWLRSDDASAVRRAKDLLRAAALAYRSTDNRDVLPVALAVWSEAERRSGSMAEARALAEEAALLVEKGAPSLLNESPIFLALYRARQDDRAGATEAIRRGIAPLLRRLGGLGGSSYAKTFLTALRDNEHLLRLAREEGLLPPEVPALLAPE